MIVIEDIMTKVEHCLSETATLEEAVSEMKNTKWNTLPVTNESGRLVGVFTRSVLFEMLLQEVPLTACIAPYLKREVQTVREQTSYEEVERLVKESAVGTGIVTDNHGRVTGVFTKTDMITALFESERLLKEQLEIILSSSELGALLTDHEQRILYMNEQLEVMLGKSLADVYGKPYHDYFPIDVTKKPHSPQQLSVGSMAVIGRFAAYQHVSGKTGIIALFSAVSNVEVLANELESVKRLKGLLDTAIDHAYDGIVTVDETGAITLLSPPLLELFSLDKTKAVGQHVDEILPQLRLNDVLQSGIADVSDLLEYKGISYLVQRIPVIQDNKIVGAIGKVMYRQLHEVRALFKKLDQMESQVNFYKKELQKSEKSRFTMEQIITEDESMERLKRIAAKAAKGRSTILVRGESGTGKELLAHAIHAISVRKNAPFVTVNCAAIPEHLLESEFFGYEPGAFTGAKQKGKLGKFDLANGGTLFLDEIGDMSPQLQAKLLRVLQEKEFYRVGGTERIRVDVRIIAATNRELEEMVDSGSFREDLFYRLNVISLVIPPLRERKQDIVLLMNHFIEEFNALLGTSIVGVEASALPSLLRYDWPGNVRELRNIIERAVTFAEHGKIKREDLPDYMQMTEMEESLSDEQQNLLAETEYFTILNALEEASGNKSKAARLLGISRSVLYSKLKKYK